MKNIVGYIKQYFREIDKRILLLVSLFTAVLIFISYRYDLDKAIRKNNWLAIKLVCWYGVFLVAFSVPYLFTKLFKPFISQGKGTFIAFILLAPFLFAIKISLAISFRFSADPGINNYWNHIIYWPALLVIIAGIVWLVWKYVDSDQPFYGIRAKDISWKPYILMLLIMLPVIAAASTQADFLAVYPKLKNVAGLHNEAAMSWWQKVLFELSYGSDFITIEIFFRGFLILAFIKWAGKDAILPMACFYCMIHIGKPLPECISSYFGGMTLGIVVYHTRSIFGGLMVHLGIAWLMELGGYIGNNVCRF